METEEEGSEQEGELEDLDVEVQRKDEGLLEKEQKGPPPRGSSAAGERKLQRDTSRWRSKGQWRVTVLMTHLSQDVPARESERRAGRWRRVSDRIFEGSCWAPDRSRLCRAWQRAAM